MVVEEGGEKAHTINLCHQSYNEQLSAAGQAATESVAMERSGGEESATRDNLERGGK